MTTYNIHDLAYSKGVPEPVREALLVMQDHIQDLYRQIETLEKQLDDQYKMGMEAEREVCLEVIETHRIPVGNSAAGEMACEWTYDALKEIAAAIRARKELK